MPQQSLISELSGFIAEVEIKRITQPHHPIRTELGNLEELASSIMKNGLLHPIIVRPVDNHFELVAGLRRLNACRILGMKKIPCNIIHLDEKEAYELSLIENLERKTLDPIEEARAFKKYVDECGYGSMSQLAERIGRSEQFISLRLRLLTLPRDLLEKVTSRLVTPSHAAELIGLSESEQRLVSNLVVNRRLSTKEVRRITKHMKCGLYEDLPAFPVQAVDSTSDKKSVRITRMLGKCIVLLRMTLISLDEIVDHTKEDEWMVREVLVAHRKALHNKIDNLLKIEKKAKYFHTV